MALNENFIIKIGTFGWALEMIKKGETVRRASWREYGHVYNLDDRRRLVLNSPNIDGVHLVGLIDVVDIWATDWEFA